MMVFQMSSALLDACVLAVLARRDCYGYGLTAEIRETLEISESTLYPVLRRLQKDGLVTTYDQEYQGRNRRYYRITSSGVLRSTYYRREWEAFKTGIDRVMEGESTHDKE